MVDQIAVVTFTTPAVGDPAAYDVTHPSITETFSAAILIFSGSDTDDADIANAVLGMGFVAPDTGATTQEQAICACAEDVGGTTPDTGTRQDTANCVNVADPLNVASAATVVAQYSSSIAGGVRLNFSTRTIQVRCTAILFAGLARAYTSDISSGVASASENVGGTTDFEPDLVITLPSNGSNNTNNNDAQLGIGFALNDGVPTQVSGYVNSDDATEPTDADGRLASAAFVSRMNSARTESTASISAFTATGFDHIATAAGSGSHYLALKFSGAVRIACANMAVAASATDQSFNAFGFTPDLVLGLSTLLGSVDSTIDGATAGACGYFVTGRYGSRGYTWHHQEGLGPGTGIWNAGMRHEDVAVLTYDHTGTVAQRATWVGGSGSGGFVLNFSTATAGYLTALGIQLIPNPPLPVRRPARQRRPRARIQRRQTIIGGKPVGGQPLGVRFWRAITRMRRAAQARLRWRPPIFGATPEVGELVDGSSGTVSGPGMYAGTIAGPEFDGAVSNAGTSFGTITGPGVLPDDFT